MIVTAASALLSHWARNRWQFLTLLAGIALSTALWSGVQAINAEARASYASAADVLGAGDVPRVLRVDGAAITVSEYVELRRAGWPVSPVLEGRRDISGTSFRLVGIDVLTFPGAGIGGQGPSILGEDPIADPVVLAHPMDVEALAPLEMTLRPDATRPRGSVLMDIAQADRLLGADGEIKRLLLGAARPFGLGDLPRTYRIAETVVQTDVARLTQSFHLNLAAFGLLSFAVGIFIVYGAVGLAFEQRRGVFRTLRALGVPLRSLVLLMIVELGVVALIAGALGVAIGYVIAAALLPDVAATLRGLYGAEVGGQLQFRAEWWASGLAMALGGTAIASAAAFYKLVRLPLLSFNHPRAMRVSSQKAARLLAFAGGMLGLLGFGFVWFADGLLAGFGLLAGLLIGTAFCLPWILSTALQQAERQASSAWWQWFWADSRQQLPGLSMALMALMLALAANVGVSTMVSSFRLTFTAYLDQRLASELYVRAQSAEQAHEVESFLREHAEAVLPGLSIDVRLGGLPAEVIGLRDHATYRDNWPMLSSTPNVWDELENGQGALVNEQLARRENWKLRAILPSQDRVIGIYSDYGNSNGQIIVSEAVFRDRYPDVDVMRFAVRTETPEQMADTLRARFELGAEDVINQQDLKQLSLAIFERTFSVTAALNIMTLSVAGVAIFISLLTLATMRLPQLAPVWALGVTRAALARLEVLRAVCLAALTSLLAIPVGLALSWVLLAIVNVEAFGWRLPLYFFPADYAQLTVLALFAAVVAALYPAFRLARAHRKDLLKVFSNDR